MGMNFTPRESRALCGMLARDSGDVVLKADREGFILHASGSIDGLGVAFEDMLIGPHLLDLVAGSHKSELEMELLQTLAGHPSGRWIEFPAPNAAWFELQLCGLADAGGEICSILGIVRSISEKKSLEERLFATELTDPLTGLTNRRAFVAMLQYLVDRRIAGSVALFDIDHFKTINLRFGQSAGDRVLVAFSDLLRSLMRTNDIVSRFGGECLAVLLPEAEPQVARHACAQIVETLSASMEHAGPQGPAITASAGIASIGPSLDDTIRRAEMALITAKARGRNRLEVDGEPYYCRALRSA